MLGVVVWEFRAVGQNASHNPPPPRTPTAHLSKRLKCGLEAVFICLIFEGVQKIFPG